MGNRGTLTINHYQQRVSDLIQDVRIQNDSQQYVNTNTPEIIRWRKFSQYINSATIRQFGWEGTGSLQVGPFSLQGTYSWTDSRILRVNRDIPGGGFEHDGMSFAGVVTHTGSAIVTYAAGRSSITINTSFVGKSLITGVSPYGDDSWYYNRQQTRMPMYLDYTATSAGNLMFTKPGYTRTNINAMRRLNNWVSATLNVINVGNNVDSDGPEGNPLNPALGRQTTMGLSLKYPSR